MTSQPQTIASPPSAPPDRAASAARPRPPARLEDLAQIIEAYNQVTEKLQQSHENLQAEVARLRAELASKDAQLQRSRRLSALGEMAAGIAHEIRNPLAAIQLYASMAGEDLGDVIQRRGEDADADAASALDSTQKIAAAVQGLSAIVNDVLTFARQSPPDPRPLAVAEALRRAVAAHQPAIEQAGIEVVYRIEAEAAQVEADASQLQQVLLNLVRNAVDAMAERDEHHPRMLTLAARRDDAGAGATSGEGVTLAVTDTGSGIDEAAVDRIFNPFFTTRGTGTGLGLAIVHRLVDAHGGAITVHNAPAVLATSEDTRGKPSEELSEAIPRAGGGAVFELFFPDSLDPESQKASLP